MEPVIIMGKVRTGGISTSSITSRTRVEVIIEPGQPAEVMKLIEMLEKGDVALFHILGDKGTDVDFPAVVWKIKTTFDGKLTFTFEMDKGNSDKAVLIIGSTVKDERIMVTIEGDQNYGDYERSVTKPEWKAKKREYPN